MITRRTPLYHLLVTVLLLGAFVVPAWPTAVQASDPSAPAYKPGVTEVVLAKKLDAEQKPVEPTDSFGPSDVFYCSAYITNGVVGTQVSAKWFHGDQMIDQAEITLQKAGSAYVGFDLTSANGEWPADDTYRLDLLVDAKPVRTLYFSVVSAAQVNSRIRSATLTREVDANFKPTAPTLLFRTTDTLHCSVLADLAEGAVVTAKWYANGELLADNVVSYTANSSFENAYVHFYLEPKQPFPAGSYSIEILLDGQMVRSIDFLVKAAASPTAKRTASAAATPAPLKATPMRVATATSTSVPTDTPKPTGPAQATIGPITFAAEVDANSQPVQPATQFPAGTQTIYAVFDYEGFQQGDAYEQVWYVDGKETARGSFEWTEAENGTYQGSLTNDQGLTSGNYKLEILLNGDVLGSGEFVIEQGLAMSETPAVETETPTVVQTAPVVEPPATDTPEPMPTETLEPTPTETLEPTPTETLEPTPTETLEPAPTETLEATATPLPSPTKPKVAAVAGKIAYTRTDAGVHSIWVMGLDGKGQKKIANYASDPAWSPDGKSLVFFGWDGDPRGSSGIYQINADGSGARLIWNEGTAAYLTWARSAARWVAMSGLKGILVYDGKEGKWQAVSPGEQPSFAPDGSRLVAHSCDGGACGLFVMGRDGSNRSRITSSGDDFMPYWSPTGKRIAYSQKQGSGWQIWAVNPDGSGAKQLTNDPSTNVMPAWLPDGSGIVYRSTQGGSWGIWIMNADGSKPRKLIDVPTADDWGRDRLDVR